MKNSQKYYDDCAQILLEMITAYLGPHYFPSIPPSVEYLMDEIPEMPVPIPRVGNKLVTCSGMEAYALVYWPSAIVEYNMRLQ